MLRSGSFSHWRRHQIFTKRNLLFQKHYQIVKSWSYETFPRLLIWLQRSSCNSPVVRRVSTGGTIGLFFRKKSVVPHPIEPRILKLIVRSEAKAALALPWFVLAGKTRLLSCRFGRTYWFWLPLELRLQLLGYSQNASLHSCVCLGLVELIAEMCLWVVPASHPRGGRRTLSRLILKKLKIRTADVDE